MTPTHHATDQYLLQKVMGAGPEQLVALLLEGGQRFLTQAVQAMAKKDYEAKGRHIDRVLAIIEELNNRLNHQDGGELVTNLARVYDWWGREVFEAGARMEPAKLENIKRLMGEMRQSWEQLHERKVAEAGRRTGAFAADMAG